MVVVGDAGRPTSGKAVEGGSKPPPPPWVPQPLHLTQQQQQRLHPQEAVSRKPGSHSQPPPFSRGDWLRLHFLENLPRPPRLSQQPSPHFRFSKHLEALLNSLCNFPSVGWLSTARSPGRLLCAPVLPRGSESGGNRAGFADSRQSPGRPLPDRQVSSRSLFPPKRPTGIPPDRPAAT